MAKRQKRLFRPKCRLKSPAEYLFFCSGDVAYSSAVTDVNCGGTRGTMKLDAIDFFNVLTNPL